MSHMCSACRALQRWDSHEWSNEPLRVYALKLSLTFCWALTARIIEGSPAHVMNYLQEGDLLSKISDVTVRALPKAEVDALLRGPKGSIVKIDVRRSTAERNSPVFDMRVSVNIARTWELDKAAGATVGAEKETPDDRDAFEAMHATFARKLAEGERISSIIPSIVFAAHPPSAASPDDRSHRQATGGAPEPAPPQSRGFYVGKPFVYDYDWAPFASATGAASSSKERQVAQVAKGPHTPLAHAPAPPHASQDHSRKSQSSVSERRPGAASSRSCPADDKGGAEKKRRWVEDPHMMGRWVEIEHAGETWQGSRAKTANARATTEVRFSSHALSSAPSFPFLLPSFRPSLPPSLFPEK